jgi:adenylate kinase family enzyme
MSKILIFGNSGSGKSTLAGELARVENLAHLDLDTLAWLPVVPPERAPLEKSRKTIEEFIAANENWVIEGCYADLMEIVASQADEIIFMNLPVEQCIENARNRPWEPHKYVSKEAQNDNLEMLVDWISQYRERKDVFSWAAHMSLFKAFPGKKTMYVNNERMTREASW